MTDTTKTTPTPPSNHDREALTAAWSRGDSVESIAAATGRTANQTREWVRGLVRAELVRGRRGALVSKVRGARNLINLGLAAEGRPGMNNAPTVTLTDAGRAMLAEIEATDPPRQPRQWRPNVTGEEVASADDPPLAPPVSLAPPVPAPPPTAPRREWRPPTAPPVPRPSREWRPPTEVRCDDWQAPAAPVSDSPLWVSKCASGEWAPPPKGRN